VTAAAASPSSPSSPSSGPAQTVSFVRAAAVIAGAVLFVDVAFFFLSQLYFNSHTVFVRGVEGPKYTGDAMMAIRVAFFVFTAVVGGAALVASAWPRIAGHAIGVAMGIGSFIAGCIAASRGLPGALIGAEIVLGALMPFLAFRSWQGSRAAWSFLIAMCGVYAIVLFFGAPTVHRVLGVGLWTSLILPGLNIVALVSLIQLRANYRE
jgi:hypothetical protein